MLLIYLLIIMILRFVFCAAGDDIKDLSQWCTRGRNIYYYLTSGAGFTDKTVTMIASENRIDCTLTFSVKAGNHIMIVMEFPDLKSTDRVCYTHDNSSVTIRDYNGKHLCQNEGKKSTYYSMYETKAVVRLLSEGKMNTVKIISTSMRDGERHKCSYVNEAECNFNGKIYCMSITTLCDGHNNCGGSKSQDEDERNCKGPVLSIFMIMCTLIMTLLSLLLVISCAMALLPGRKETFVHVFDKSITLFDCDNGIIKAEINIITLPRRTGSEAKRRTPVYVKSSGKHQK